MSFVMATLTEINFIRDILEELITIGDFSDYYEDQAREAMELLESLKKYDLAIDSYRNFLKIAPVTSNKHREIAQNHLTALKSVVQNREKSKMLKKKPRKKLDQKKQESKSLKPKTDPENIEA